MVNTLADNARKFTPAGGKVCIKAVEEADYVELSVEDTGCGINEETQQHLFDQPIHDQTALHWFRTNELWNHQ